MFKPLLQNSILLSVDFKSNTDAMRYLHKSFVGNCLPHTIDSKQDAWAYSHLFKHLSEKHILRAVNFKQNTWAIRYLYQSLVGKLLAQYM